MKLRTWMVAAMLVTACAACGDDPEIQNPNNDENNANNANNATNNPANSGTNNPANSGTNNPNSGMNNPTNSGMNNPTNNATNNPTNNATNNPTNNATNNPTNNGNPLACNGDFASADACGGDPTGSWAVTEACTNYDYEGELQQACSDAVVQDAVVNVSGTLDVDAVTWSRTVTGELTVDLSSATGCGFGNCALVEAGLGVVTTSATCADDGSGGCDCTATVDLSSSSMGTYSTDAGIITIGSGETFHYCVSGDTLLTRRFGTMSDPAQPTFLYEK